ncbi:hypothetical protein [Metabacillus niabensis]|uniref:Permease n=1 Tax=Metabacillus niabensis TaxID=324854 RepID=A0ABT9Z4M2_9BACI|nr:hypothetical protein [Metabacillus niabensis]MDQ0226518.1 hypothetical protein [Metabacillus niabensis]
MKITSQRNFNILGVLFAFIFAVRVFMGLSTNSLSIVELLSWGTLSYLSFAAGYLYPQFKEKDERSELIKQKGMHYSMFFVLVFFIATLLGNQFNIFGLELIEMIQIVIALTIITIFTSWIIMAKKY